MNAKGQASNIIKAAKKSRIGNRVKVMKAICKIIIIKRSIIPTQFQTEKISDSQKLIPFPNLKISNGRNSRIPFNSRYVR